jgi:uncharacterized protein with ParB-like and HNH nuclease domain
MNKIDVNNYRISDVFTKFYVVPDYQREYVWEEKNYRQLLEDITEEYSSNRNSEYFIGSIVVCERADDKRLEVIDGQQRLTTLFVCLSAFKKLLDQEQDVSDIKQLLYAKTRDSSGKQKENYKLELQYEESTDVIKKVTDDNVSQEWLVPSSRRIVEAYIFSKDYIKKNLVGDGEVGAFLGYFLNNVKLVQIETPNVSDALKIFETINERGVGLNPMDLLKNLIFRQVKKEEFEKLKIKWKKIITILDKAEEKPLRFLRYFIMANYKVSNNPLGEEIIREDEIYNWITKDENVKQCNYEEKPFEFVKFMLENAQSYVAFLNGYDKEGNKNRYFENIKRLGGGGFRQHLILMLSAKDMNNELLSHLAKQIEAMMFYYFITREPTKEFERKFSKWAKSIKPIKTKEELNKFILDNLTPEISAKEESFKRSFQSLSSDVFQVYRLRYILAKLTEYVDRNYLGNKDEKDITTYIMKGIEIEHILPYTPTEELLKSFNEFSGTPSADQLSSFNSNYDQYKIKLGNLTLLEKPMNIVASNDFFQNKQRIYKDSIFYLTRSLSGFTTVGINSSVNRTNTLLKEYSKWDKESIDSRQEVLFNLAKNIWKIEVLA